jgi:putative endonuclease
VQGFKKQVGDKGEDIAADFLKDKGYNIIQRNYRCRYGEIDIIAEHDRTIIFAEVRTRRTETFGSPQGSITSSKIDKISKTALCYIQEKNLIEQACRFDVIAITYSKGSQKPNIIHIENAFEISRKYMY